jgi:thiol-disulfide isomerase/thioredoxin
MKRHNLLFSSLLFLMIAGCQPTGFHIDGHITGMENGNIMLFTFKGDTIFSVDTATIKNGKFIFEGQEFLDDIAILSAGNYPDKVKAAEVVLDRGKIIVNFDSVASVTGSPMNEIYNSFKKKSEDYGVKIHTLIRNGADPGMYPVGSKLYLLYDSIQEYERSFMIANIKNPVGLRVFKNEIKPNIDMKDSVFQEILYLVPKKYQSDREITKNVEFKRIQKEKDEKRLKLVGKKYIDFDLITPENMAVKLSDYMGHSKFTIIEFWASWCAPCIAGVPWLKKLYSKYNDKGLKIISISLDDKMSDWQRVLKKVDAPWIHLSDLKGKRSALTEAYLIEGIPRSLLIDKNGIIIEVNIPPQVLENILQRTLGNNDL